MAKEDMIEGGRYIKKNNTEMVTPEKLKNRETIHRRKQTRNIRRGHTRSILFLKMSESRDRKLIDG